ncbi:glutathione S-transferase A isoform X2 [Lingula anatina]|uniref:Glutathione S-transferase A isoform X2 n=1 Tax=Lingula anatina TaxID=7574 RepID=A0A1S3H5L8_LINAN|nr:glutathione S-transferase A isoform X2 [Lingula anatina]|eukprot:XP_013381262.1 glutathione S-transferase A isoform X2 [Lingula anatina]
MAFATAGRSMKLYWGSGSAPCWRVMAVLEEKGLGKYDSKLISFDKNETKSEEIMKLNPRGEVPTFVIGEIVINESLATCLYLEDTYKSSGVQLIPSDCPKKAQVLQRTFEAPGFMKKGLEDLGYLYMEGDVNEEEMKEKKTSLKAELALWEGYLKAAGGDYLTGQDFTMADCIFFPVLAVMVRLGLALRPTFPELGKYYETVSKRPSIMKTWPPHWKGTEGKKWLNNVC